jgi:hypothetical protein
MELKEYVRMRSLLNVRYSLSSCRDWGEPRKISDIIVGLHAVIWTRGFPNFALNSLYQSVLTLYVTCRNLQVLYGTRKHIFKLHRKNIVLQEIICCENEIFIANLQLSVKGVCLQAYIRYSFHIAEILSIWNTPRRTLNRSNTRGFRKT